MSESTLTVLGPSVLPTAITPDSLVVVGHRGGPALLEMFDGIKWDIPSRSERDEEFLMPYGVALLLRRRAVVPGSRDPHSGRAGAPLKQKSYLYIRPFTQDGRKVPEGDRMEDCRPFTAAELARYGVAGEAIARSADSPVRMVDVSEVQATLLAQGTDLEDAVNAPVDPAVLAPIPASQHSGIQEARALAAEQGDDPAPRGRVRR